MWCLQVMWLNKMSSSSILIVVQIDHVALLLRIHCFSTDVIFETLDEIFDLILWQKNANDFLVIGCSHSYHPNALELVVRSTEMFNAFPNSKDRSRNDRVSDFSHSTLKVQEKSFINHPIFGSDFLIPLISSSIVFIYKKWADYSHHMQILHFC